MLKMFSKRVSPVSTVSNPASNPVSFPEGKAIAKTPGQGGDLNAQNEATEKKAFVAGENEEVLEESDTVIAGAASESAGATNSGDSEAAGEANEAEADDSEKKEKKATIHCRIYRTRFWRWVREFGRGARRFFIIVVLLLVARELAPGMENHLPKVYEVLDTIFVPVIEWAYGVFKNIFDILLSSKTVAQVLEWLRTLAA